MRLSVTARIALLAIGLALVSNLFLVGFMWRQLHTNAMEAVRRDTVEQSDALYAVWQSGGMDALRRAIAEARAPGDRSLILAVVASDGSRKFGMGPRDATVSGPMTAQHFTIGTLGGDRPWSEHEAGYAVRPVGGDWLISGRLLDDWQREQHAIEKAMLAATLLSLALGVVGGLVITRYVGRRLDGVAAVIEGVVGGDLTRRVATAATGQDAFDRLALRLNAMLDRLERLMTELRVVTDSFAHDLRSPLARLRTKAEAAVLQADPVQREVAMSGLLAETDLVMRMLTMLIEISRAESVSRDRMTSVDPVELIEEITELYAPVVEDAGMRFRTAIDPAPGRTVLHRELVTQAITNLIDNALRHAAGGGEIAVRLIRDAGAIHFQIEDRGPGIAPEDRAQALRRFGRLDGARTTPGAGLGMALVDAVARLHGGRLDLGDNRPGLIATIVLPDG